RAPARRASDRCARYSGCRKRTRRAAPRRSAPARGSAPGREERQRSSISLSVVRAGLLGSRKRFTVEPEGFDLGGTAQLLQLRIDDVVGERLAQLLARLIKSRRLAEAPVLDLDHVPAELGLDGFPGVLARRHREGGIGKRGNHVVMAEIAEIAT